MERWNRRRISFAFLASSVFFMAGGVVPACHLINGIDNFETDPILDITPPPPCATENDCPGTDTECSQRTCISNACGTKFTLKGTPVLEQVIGDCLVNQCDGVGHRVDDIVDTSDFVDDGKECSADSCSVTGNPLHEPLMAGTPCAMSPLVCDGKDACVECVVDTHCMIDRVCSMNHCVSKTCLNLMKDGAESDIDCGGTECQACANGSICNTGADCESKTCTMMNLCAVPACDDVQQNGQETDVDCGGTKTIWSTRFGFASLVCHQSKFQKCKRNMASGYACGYLYKSGSTRKTCLLWRRFRYISLRKTQQRQVGLEFQNRKSHHLIANG